MKNTDYSKYLGNPYQLYGTRHYTLHSDYSKGVSAIDVKTGSGFEYTILPSRALDISLASFKGMNITYLSPNSESHPSYFINQGSAWLKSFFGGLLTTCGPFNIGKAAQTKGRQYGLHDSFSNTPAQNVCDSSLYEDKIKITGMIDFGVLCQEKIRVNRTIESELFSSSVKITDKIENYGYEDSVLTILYHTNFGYPFLDEDSNVYIDSNAIECYDTYSKNDLANICNFSAPDGTMLQKNYFHTMNSQKGYAYAAVVNPSINNLGVLLKFNVGELGYVTHCKNENPVDYLLAIEPCNTLCIGRNELARRNMLPVIKPGETKTMSLQLSIFEGIETEQNILKRFNK